MSLLDTASLIVTPNGYKEGKLYSVIPSDGSGDLSVVRATTATRVNSAGLVELVPYNLLQYSEDFTNAAWIKITTTLTSGQSDPFGGNNAYKWNSSAIGVTQLSQSFSTGADVCNISIYAKAGSTSILNIWIGSAVTFDLANGSVTSGTGTITSVGNGWYRCSTNRSSISLTNTLNPYFSAASTSDFIYIYGGQAVEGSTAKDYQKTETRLNIPRLDYSNGTCPSLLVEPQRTNLLTYSSSFDDASWIKASTTITANTTISPSGIQDAETAVFGSNGQMAKIIISNAVNTFSTYVKKGTNRYFSIQLETISVVYRAIYDLDTTAVTFTGTNTSASITDEGNGWFRVSVVNTTSDAIAYTTFQAASSGTSVSGGSGTFYIWGAQLEAGNYSTSFIPTTSASVTRNADVISKTGISSLIGQTEGTMFADFYHNGQDILISQQVLFVSSGNTSNFIAFGVYDGRLNPGVRASNVDIFDVFAGPNPLTEGRHRVALAYKSGDFAVYLDGTQVYTNTNSATFGTMSQIDLGNTLSFSTQLGDGINAAALWQTRLTNTQLASLTTL